MIMKNHQITDSAAKTNDKVAIIMGSTSDKDKMAPCWETLNQLEIDFTLQAISAHRAPDQTIAFAQKACENGFSAIIAGAGAAAALPGLLAAKTVLPVIGVPLDSTALNGIDSLLSIAQMPAGIPVATMAIGKHGAKNAALFAARILALKSPQIQQKLTHYLEEQTRKSLHTFT